MKAPRKRGFCWREELEDQKKYDKAGFAVALLAAFFVFGPFSSFLASHTITLVVWSVSELYIVNAILFALGFAAYFYALSLVAKPAPGLRGVFFNLSNRIADYLYAIALLAPLVVVFVWALTLVVDIAPRLNVLMPFASFAASFAALIFAYTESKAKTALSYSLRKEQNLLEYQAVQSLSLQAANRGQYALAISLLRRGVELASQVNAVGEIESAVSKLDPTDIRRVQDDIRPLDGKQFKQRMMRLNQLRNKSAHDTASGVTEAEYKEAFRLAQELNNMLLGRS